MTEKKGEKRRAGEAKGASAAAGLGPGAAPVPGTGAEAGPTFEQALARLEKIVQDLEGGDLTLEETLVRYEEGARLAADCARRLDEAEQRIRVLSNAEAASSGAEAEDEDDDGQGSQDGLPF